MASSMCSTTETSRDLSSLSFSLPWGKYPSIKSFVSINLFLVIHCKITFVPGDDKEIDFISFDGVSSWLFLLVGFQCNIGEKA